MTNDQQEVIRHSLLAALTQGHCFKYMRTVFSNVPIPPARQNRVDWSKVDLPDLFTLAPVHGQFVVTAFSRLAFSVDDFAHRRIIESDHPPDPDLGIFSGPPQGPDQFVTRFAQESAANALPPLTQLITAENIGGLVSDHQILSEIVRPVLILMLDLFARASQAEESIRHEPTYRNHPGSSITGTVESDDFVGSSRFYERMV